jgi:hypothetical protein
LPDEETAKHLVPGGAARRESQPCGTARGRQGRGGAALALCDLPLLVPHPDTARLQEAHQFLLHCLMGRIEAGLRS